VAVVGTAAAAGNAQIGQALAERRIVARELTRVACVELLGVVELRVALARRAVGEEEIALQLRQHAESVTPQAPSL
jgi:hypothetical protein